MGGHRWRYQAQAYQFLATAQGQWGLRHGCGLALWEHVAEFSSFPSRNEIQRIFEAVNRNRECVESGNLGICAGPLTAIWQRRMEIEAELARQHLVEVAA